MLLEEGLVESTIKERKRNFEIFEILSKCFILSKGILSQCQVPWTLKIVGIILERYQGGF